MATLFKEAKRGKPLPRVVDGFVHAGERYADNRMIYTLGVTSRQRGANEPSYDVRLSETEMLRVCGEWMKMLAHRREREEVEARNQGGHREWRASDA